jgi:hypothetical protein
MQYKMYLLKYTLYFLDVQQEVEKMYKKSIWGIRYIRWMTRTPWPFLGFVGLGIGLFLYLMLSTKIEVIKTYSAQVIQNQTQITVGIKEDLITDAIVYIYSNKNEAVYPVSIVKTENVSPQTLLYFDDNGQKVLSALLGKELFIDITQRKESLLYQIFVRGGNRRE